MVVVASDVLKGVGGGGCRLRWVGGGGGLAIIQQDFLLHYHTANNSMHTYMYAHLTDGPKFYCDHAVRPK